MNENVIDVLIYIYENYMEGDENIPPDQIMLEEELAQAGFPAAEIKKAFDWLDDLARHQVSMNQNPISNPSMRMFTANEQQRLDLEARGLLLTLEQSGLLDNTSRELVIERAMALDEDHFSSEDIKWIALLVLMNQPGKEMAFAQMEDMIYNGPAEHLH
ncbi:MAG: DUF494 domain-containing protein [Chromatiales bacterium]